ncbi:hypothetical protein Ancab_000203 [Ancistrocladus abbreviatus]
MPSRQLKISEVNSGGKRRTRAKSFASSLQPGLWTGCFVVYTGEFEQWRFRIGGNASYALQHMAYMRLV